MFTEVFAGIAVSDYEVAAAWYERLLDRPPDMVPTDGEACWRLTGSGWIYVLLDPANAGHSVVTLLLDDFDAHLARASDSAEPVIEKGGMRTAWVRDPDGNRIQFGQPL